MERKIDTSVGVLRVEGWLTTLKNGTLKDWGVTFRC
jgi:hypothetical protein